MLSRSVTTPFLLFGFSLLLLLCRLGLFFRFYRFGLFCWFLGFSLFFLLRRLGLFFRLYWLGLFRWLLGFSLFFLLRRLGLFFFVFLFGFPPPFLVWPC